MTAMMLEVLAKMAKTHAKSRAATVCRCIFTVYSATHGTKPPWELLGIEEDIAKERAIAQPVTIIDVEAEAVSED